MTATMTEEKITLPICPYKGMEPFQYIDRNIFFTRDEEIKKLVRLIALYRGVLLYSPSGVGKSSLINAGLYPAREQFPKGDEIFMGG